MMVLTGLGEVYSKDFTRVESAEEGASATLSSSIGSNSGSFLSNACTEVDSATTGCTVLHIKIHPHSQDKSVVSHSEDGCRPSRVQGFHLCSALTNHKLTCHNRFWPTAFGGKAAPQPQSLLAIFGILMANSIKLRVSWWWSDMLKFT